MMFKLQFTEHLSFCPNFCLQLFLGLRKKDETIGFCRIGFDSNSKAKSVFFNEIMIFR